MANVRQIMKKKGDKIFSIRPDQTIMDALKLMEAMEIGAVLVMENEKVVGIFSERDYARRGILKGNTTETLIKEVMTKTVFFVGPDYSVDECMALMTDKRIRHLPVVESGELLGVISIGDVVKHIIADQMDLIRGMENYILGRDYNQ